MKRKNIILLISIVIFGIVMSCNDDNNEEDECIINKIEYVTSINSPNTGTINDTVNIEVNFRVFNGCGRFGKFIESENGNIRNIEVEAEYEDCYYCTQAFESKTVNYEFKSTNSGNYELKFKSSPTEFITVNLTIN